ncbi:hypothetical protein CDD83_9157 [Cordyceps sp. RAO-2017]|nr:hypothetical protein CDD83_9157 [Cordyceps sp. RAO-2017]
MAFQQPTRQVMQRVARPSTVDGHGRVHVGAPASSERHAPESQSWVLFSPPTEVTTTSYLSETDRSLATPGRSQLSDLGSLNTAPRSAQPAHDEPAPSLSAIDDASLEDDAELDSLDSHLPEFRSLPGTQDVPSRQGSQQPMPVLPTHDGLGSFRLSYQPVLGRDAQDQIYQFERFNPRRVRRRLDSFHRGQLDLEHGQHPEEEKRLRIEAWRLDHSRTLLDEVQRETRRRRKSQASMQRFQRSSEAESDNLSWHDEDHLQPEEEEGSLLARITRKVVKDLLGIDDRLLSLLLGGAPPESDAPPSPQHHLPGEQGQEPVWQLRLLETLSRELGLLINRLSHHPGAFSTFARLQQTPLPYAGLPVIPESSDAPQPRRPSEAEQLDQSSAAPEFQPTMRQQPRPAEMATDEAGDRARDEARDEARAESTFTQEEWEKELDVKLVFRYLMSRFSGRSKNAMGGGAPHASTPTAQDSAAKITRVRQHHPLIARSRPVERRGFKTPVPASPVSLRHHSSCASQSTRRSARQSSCSSRHYWDLGGSMGTGSVIASHGPMGSWGEI